MYLGIDISGGNLKIGVVTPEGRVLAKSNYNLTSHVYVCNEVVSKVDEFLMYTDFNFKVEKVSIICDKKSLTNESSVVKELMGILRDKFNVDVNLIDEIDAMLIAEASLGRAAGYKKALGIEIGHRVNFGIMSNSKIIENDFEVCNFEKANLSALVEEVKKSYEKLGTICVPCDELNERHVFALLKGRNKIVREIVDKWVESVGDELIKIVDKYEIETIIIASVLSEKEHLFIDPIRKYVNNNMSRDIAIRSSALSKNSRLVSCAY